LRHQRGMRRLCGRLQRLRRHPLLPYKEIINIRDEVAVRFPSIRVRCSGLGVRVRSGPGLGVQVRGPG